MSVWRTRYLLRLRRRKVGVSHLYRKGAPSVQAISMNAAAFGGIFPSGSK